MKRLVSLLLVLLTMLLSPLTAFAEGDPNIDNGGGDMGSGTGQNSWTPGRDGVRVTVIRDSDNQAVTSSIDFADGNTNDVNIHFGKVSKIQYRSGASLTPKQGGYHSLAPRNAMPVIISSQSQGASSLQAIKDYFCREGTIRDIADATGFDYDRLISGDYKILLEPIAYFKYEGVMYAMTATEAALFDQRVSGGLRSKMVSLTHKNLPLSMFLETADLGFSAWTGSKTSRTTNENIISYLGLGIIRFSEIPEPPAVTTYDYEYRISTEVITAVMVGGGQSDPDRPTRVSFIIGGTTYNVGNVYYPEGDSQLAWVKWRTPDTAQDMVITVTVSGPGSSSKATINVEIVDLDKNPPPNPVANDRNDSFSYASVPSRPQQSSASWSVWRPWWHEYWVWYGDDEDGYWEDEGWWEYDLNRYNASLSSSISIQCDSKNPTASGRTMKSGYGINQTVTGNISSNQSSAVTQPQNAVSYFPEFRYETYWRLLERMGAARFEFKKNPYSTYRNRTHFSPIWMPDGAYTVNTWLIDAWTPSGMLSANLTDSLTISGNLWQDWHVAPLQP